MATLKRSISEGLCVGIDLHKDTLMACVINAADGEIVWERLACKCRDKIVALFTEWKQRGHLIVAIEAVGFYRWLWDLLQPLVDELYLADARQCRALAGRRLKTDREDALNVAHLLMSGRLPVAYAPPPEVCELRDSTRHRHFLRRQHACCLHRVRSVMNMNNRPGPDKLEGEQLIHYLKAYGHLLPERHVKQLWQAVDQLLVLERQIAEADRDLARLLHQSCFQNTAQLLRSVPGVGPIVSATVIAELGDFQRFPDDKSLSKYVGLSPTVYASADQCHTGHICKTGPRDLRWVLQQAAWVAIRCDARVKKLYLRLRKRCDSKRAAVAIARKLLVWMAAMIRHNEPYRKEQEAA